MKNRDMEISFSSLYFKQSSLRDMRFDIIIYNLNIMQKKTKLLIMDMGDVEIFISPHEAISGQFIPKINEIKNKTIHIPANIIGNERFKKNNNLQTSVLNASNQYNFVIQQASLVMQRVLENTKLILMNGISVKDTRINLLDTIAGKQLNSFKIKDFYLKTTTFGQLTEKQKQDFNHLISNENDENINKSRLTLSKKIYQTISVFNKKYTSDLTIYKINVEVDGKPLLMSGMCDYNQLGKTSSCLINVENFPLTLLIDADVIHQTQISIAMKKTNVNGVLHVFFDEKGIKNATLNGELKQMQNKKIKVRSRQIKKINLSANVLNNFTKIKSAVINLYDDKNNVIANIKTNNATFNDGLLKNSNVYFTINNIKLSDFYTFIDKTLLHSYQNIHNIDGIINGTLCFSFNSNGKLVKSTNFRQQNRIQLKNLIINSKLFDFDLSKFVFSLEIIKNNIVLRTRNVNKNKSGEIILRYDYVHNGLQVRFDKTILTKSDFNQFKKLFLDATQFNIMKNIELSLLIDGQVFIPFDKTLFATKSIFNLTMQVLSTDDDLDDEILFKIMKNNNAKKGDIEINFGKSIMYSQMFAFGKQENDLSIIRGAFEFIDGKQNGLKINTSWTLNDVEKSTFKFSFIDGIVYALLKSKISQLEVVQKGREYKVGLSGSSVYVDYEFWHIILLLISFLKDYDLMQVYLDVDDGAIQDVKLDDVRFLINIKPPFFYGHFDFNMHFQGKDYNGMHFVNDRDGKYDIDIPNIIPMLTLYDIDITKFPFYKLSLSGKGKSDIKNKILDGYLNIKFDSEDTGLFGFTQLYSLNIPTFHYDAKGLMFKKGEFKARWFNVKDIDIGLLFNKQKSHITANLKALVPLISTKYVPVKMTGNTFKELFSKIDVNKKTFILDKDFQVNELVKVII
ncbi:MAG: hypothetical protein IJT15_02830 [Rickettsiales bacterium]|nr:hypothetical protein [Rickettsiales bacterium]